MATFFEQVREMGPKQAVIAKADEVVERLTSGLNINDIRSMLRGDEPRKPNPRLRPHADGFWLHIRPSFYHTEVTHIYPTFRLGWLSTFMFVWETITGIFLMIFYTPSPLVAYQDMWNIMSNVPLGQLMRDLHRLGAEAMVLVVAAHMLRTFITGSYKKPRQFTWFTGMVLLCMTLILSFSGYLLPWDQLAYWAVTVAVSAAESSPGPAFVGKNINLLLRGAPVIGAGGLLRFYLLHVILLPLITGIFIFVHYYKVVLHGLSLPPGREAIGEDTAKRVPKDERVYFLPDIFTSEMMWASLTTLVLVVGSTFFFTAPIESHANPGVTPLHVVAPWYLAWSQGWLKLASKEAIAFVFIPALATAFFVMPYLLEVGRSRRYADRRAGLSVAMFFIALMLLSNWMGSPEYLVQSSAAQEVSQDILPQEGHSILLEVPYEELKTVYELANEGKAPEAHTPVELVAGDVNNYLLKDAPHLKEVMGHFGESLGGYSCKLPGYSNPLVEMEDCVKTDLGEGKVRYDNSIRIDVIPNPEASLELHKTQENLIELRLSFHGEDEAGQTIVNFKYSKYRHEHSVYGEE